MQKRTWLHDAPQVVTRRLEFMGVLMDQYRAVNAGHTPPCAVCGALARWHQIYRCYQCDLWLCRRCTRDHFPDVRRV